ncbi:hypothetical protein SSP531S_54950 [Streptomyces spongiicola]|uniref:Uncharacterized protein n=1 Tax=Streptomyces spongiicola TaxID=1690221 RepID=A0A388T8U5_9ACTN|nr:hypothetical protein SSP531S_54950 [Streptomyces spongiicola]
MWRVWRVVSRPLVLTGPRARARVRALIVAVPAPWRTVFLHSVLVWRANGAAVKGTRRCPV